MNCPQQKEDPFRRANCPRRSPSPLRLPKGFFDQAGWRGVLLGWIFLLFSEKNGAAWLPFLSKTIFSEDSLGEKTEICAFFFTFGKKGDIYLFCAHLRPSQTRRLPGCDLLTFPIDRK